MADIPITVKGGNLPLNYEATARDYSIDFLRRLTVEVDGSRVILGSMEATEPTYNAGPWFHDDTWHAWSDELAKYVPVSLSLSTSGYDYRFNSDALSGGRSIALPDQSGTLAYLLDVYVPRESIIEGGTDLIGTTPNVDWSKSWTFMKRLSGATTFTFSNVLPGGKITVAVVNAGSSHSVTWPAQVSWPGGVTPAQPSASAGQNSAGIYTFRATGPTEIYGTMVSASLPSLSVDTGGPDTVDSQYGLNPNGLPISPNPRTPYNLP